MKAKERQSNSLEKYPEWVIEIYMQIIILLSVTVHNSSRYLVLNNNI